TQGDRQLLQSYSNLIDGLADYLGSGYEIVLHSLEDLEHSVIKIVNGEHTGRVLGAPITDLALSMLARITKENNGDYCSYNTRNKKGEPLKASTILIRGDKGKPLALLCMNFYLNTPISDLIFPLVDSVFSSSHMQSENFAANTPELVKDAVTRATDICMNDHTILPSNKNREIVRILRDQGIFRMKDGVVRVAEYMNISRNTIYMHLRNVGEK
ncbi:MAG: PAS domain-containing protein, partial [Oscillospiraceae bacterium]